MSATCHAMRFHRAILAGLAIIVAGCNQDVVESSHATVAAANSDIERGWIPSILPASTVQIRESHNLDTNVGHGTFSFGAADAEQFRTTLAGMPLGTAVRRVHFSREQLERNGYSFYTNGDFYIAVNWSSRRGEFWLAYSR